MSGTTRSQEKRSSKVPLTFSSVVSLSSQSDAEPGTISATCKLSDENDTPIIAPLDTLDQVFSWEPSSNSLCAPSIGLRPRHDHNGGSRMDDPTATKTIVCHDMMGGYIKDKYTQGHNDLNDYYFYQWQYIDAFIYFSHHLVTIPPPTWTNAAHKNGVLSMGTIITEWKEGNKICQDLLSEDWKVSQFCDQLVALSAHYKIDGWLVNIENPIHPSLMDRLYMLLSLLTTGMHTICPGSKVIWYDSVTVEGNLKWQNAVNHLNKPFFDLCDGIFLNYNWNEIGLSSSGDLAGNRRGDVYVGVDVFGRGCFGGGGYNTWKAVEVISRQNLSCALFAPGWVYETQNKEHFFQNQERFWSLLTPWIKSRSLSSLPLVSAFGRGYGERVSIDGKLVYGGYWTYHSAQDLQPSVTSLSELVTPDSSNGVRIESVVLDAQTVYNNGASLRLQGTSRQTAGVSKPALVRLFKTHVNLSSPLLVSISFTCDQPSNTTNIRVYLQLHTSGTPSRIFLDALMEPAGGDDAKVSAPLPSSTKVPHLPGCVLAPLPLAHCRYLHRLFTGDTQLPDPWITKYYIIEPPNDQDSLIQELTLGIYQAGQKPSPSSLTSVSAPFSLRLGEIKILPTVLLTAKYEIVSIWSHSYKLSEDKSSLSLTLSWVSSHNDADPIEHFNVYSCTHITSSSQSSWSSDYIYRGRAYATSYRVTDVFLLKAHSESGTRSLSFVVQPVTVSQRKSAVSDCPRLIVEFKN